MRGLVVALLLVLPASAGRAQTVSLASQLPGAAALSPILPQTAPAPVPASFAPTLGSPLLTGGLPSVSVPRLEIEHAPEVASAAAAVSKSPSFLPLKGAVVASPLNGPFSRPAPSSDLFAGLRVVSVPAPRQAARLDSLSQAASRLRDLPSISLTEAYGVPAALFDGAGRWRPAAAASRGLPRVGAIPAAAAASERPEPALPPYLVVPVAKEAELIAPIVQACGRSKTARSVLRRVEAMAARRGRPVVVTTEDLRSVNGEFVFDWALVRMSRGALRRSPEEAATTFAHELLHVLQFDEGLPGESVEMEMEAFLVTLRVARELGVKLPKDQAAAAALRRLKKSPEAYIKFIAELYGDDLGLIQGGSVEEWIEDAEEAAEKLEGKILRLKKRIADHEAVAASLKETGQPEATLRTYQDDELIPWKAALRSMQKTLLFYRRDIELLSSPEGAARYKAYVRRVREAVRRAHDSLSD